MPELTRRYIVMAMATEGPFDMEDPEAPFVLKPWKDPAALHALEAYRDHSYPALAEELGTWIKVIASGPVLRGGVGARNEQHMAAKATPHQKPQAEPQAKPHARPKVKMKVAERTARKIKRKRRP